VRVGASGKEGERGPECRIERIRDREKIEKNERS
jgi:hypothetical protein